MEYARSQGTLTALCDDSPMAARGAPTASRTCRTNADQEVTGKLSLAAPRRSVILMRPHEVMTAYRLIARKTRRDAQGGSDVRRPKNAVHTLYIP